jgi:circadian clock protein KaiB
MTTDDPMSRVKEFETALEADQHFVLQLYVTGATERSMRAIASLKKLCSEELQGRCEIEVIDIYKHPELARDEQIVVIPTLIKKLPAPIRRLIGDLSDREKVLKGLGIHQKPLDK